MTETPLSQASQLPHRPRQVLLIIDVQPAFTPPDWRVNAPTPETISHLKSLAPDRVLVCGIQTDTCVLAAGSLGKTGRGFVAASLHQPPRDLSPPLTVARELAPAGARSGPKKLIAL
jgi:hypothetical protein